MSLMRSAVAVGVVAGGLLGALEGWNNLRANLLISPDRYAAYYLALPYVLTSTLVVALVLLAYPLLRSRARRYPPPAQRDAIYRITWTACIGLATCAWILDQCRTAMIALQRTGAGGGRAFGLATGMAFVIGTMTGTLALVGIAQAWAHVVRRHAVPIVVGLMFTALTSSTALLVGLAASEGEGIFYRSIPPAQPRHSGEPNFLLISIDTLRADSVTSYGAPAAATPAVAMLAARGVVFENAISASPWTLPSLATILTGDDPRRHGVGWPAGGRDLLARTPYLGGETIATRLHELQYRTGAIVTNPYLAVHYGLSKGFDTYLNVTVEEEALTAIDHTTVMSLAEALIPSLAIDARAEQVSKRAVRWLRGNRNNQFLVRN